MSEERAIHFIQFFKSAAFNSNNPSYLPMSPTPKANNRWAGKIFSLGIITGILALTLSHAYPQYLAPIVYGACGVIFYLMIRITREIEWKK